MAKVKTMEPIPQKQVKAWNALVRETRSVVEQHDKTVFDLILLAGKVGKEYGDDRIGRWADEAGVSASAARQYAWLSRKGVDEAFIEKWVKIPGSKKKGLNYTVIREIAAFNGGLSNAYAQDYLAWALKHNATKAAIKGYMLELTAPQNHKEEVAASYKEALKVKQEQEQLPEQVRIALEQVVEAAPHLEDEVIAMAITSQDDLQDLRVRAGLTFDDETELVEKSKRLITKLRSYRKWVMTNQHEIARSIAYGHEYSEDLKGHANALMKALNAMMEIDPADGGIDETKVVQSEVKVKEVS